MATLKQRANGIVYRITRGGGQMTVSQSWELYARNRKNTEGIGDEWSNPARIGVEGGITAEGLVDYLMDDHISPWFGPMGTMVEIGAGGGRFTGHLSQFSERVIATDTSPTMIGALKERYESNPKVQPLLLDGRGLGGIDAQSVDAVFSYGVFVHLQHWDMFNYLTETARVLRPGGKAVIQHANTFSDLGWKQFTNDVPASLDRHKLGGTFSLMTPEVMREFATRAGLMMESCRTDIAARDGISFLTMP